MTKYRLVEVDWVDSAEATVWAYPENIKTLMAYSVGWLVESNKKFIVVAGCIGESGMVSQAMAIPRGCIVKIRSKK